MEPVDDILIPQAEPKRSTQRLTSKHVLRALAVILMVASLAYMGKVLKIDGEKLVSNRKEDMLAIAPFFLFGVLLWWYAGRRVDELARPLFRDKSDAPSAVRVDMRTILWLTTSLVSGLAGFSAVIIGVVFSRYAADLKKTMPVFFDKLERGLPQVQQLEAKPMPLIITGVALIVVSLVAVALATRQSRRAN